MRDGGTWKTVEQLTNSSHGRKAPEIVRKSLETRKKLEVLAGHTQFLGRWPGRTRKAASIRDKAGVRTFLRIPRRKRRLLEECYCSLGKNDNFPIFTDFYRFFRLSCKW